MGYLILGLLGAAVFAGLGIYFLQRRKKVAAWPDTKATVLEELNFKRITDRDGNEIDTFTYKISYMANGALIENKVEGEMKYNIGDTFDIKYNPSSPMKYEQNRKSNAFIPVAIIFFIMAALATWGGINKMIGG